MEGGVPDHVMSVEFADLVKPAQQRTEQEEGS
jgi:hypothetical protein